MVASYGEIGVKNAWTVGLLISGDVQGTYLAIRHLQFVLNLLDHIRYYLASNSLFLCKPRLANCKLPCNNEICKFSFNRNSK